MVGVFGIQAFLECGARGRGLYRAVDPETVGMHVHKCKGVLESVSLYLMDWPRAVTSDRKRRRKVLPNVIDQLPRHVRELSLVYWACPPRDENCDPPNLLDEGETEDALTMSLRRFYMRQKAQRLFVSHMVLGPEFYKRPGKGDRGHGTPSGPDEGSNDLDFDEEWWVDDSEDGRRPCAELEDLRVDWPKVTTYGRWMYGRHGGENADRLAWG